MRLGFTGTSEPQRDTQLERLKQELLQRPFNEFHHGDCINADENAHAIIMTFTKARVVIHPPLDKKARAFCGGPISSVVKRKPKPYLERNHDIVDEADELIACPRAKKEFQRSGTWATIRYARKKGKPITIIFPDGSIKREYPNSNG